jgi:hypothetical protein
LPSSPISATRRRYVNSVTANATDGFLDFIKKQGQTFEQAAASRQSASSHHNRCETPG